VARILLVEDDEAVREILRKALVSAGHAVEEASNGDVALAAYRREAADVVITDLVMPDKDGLETIMVLRRIDPAVKIIAMSGGGRTLGSGQLYLETARSIGALQILAKPFTGSALLLAVTEVLALPGA
jgi:CheY-like chemotaxis protein